MRSAVGCNRIHLHSLELHKARTRRAVGFDVDGPAVAVNNYVGTVSELVVDFDVVRLENGIMRDVFLA